MRVRKITLREIHMPLIAPFQTSFGTTSLRRILLVEADVDGISGWGESTAGEDPYYSYETVETARHIIRDFLWPILKGRELSSASDVSDLLGQVRGHNMAKAAVETALWDAEAKHKNLPAREIARRRPRRDFLRRLYRHSIIGRRADRESRKGTRRRLPAHQDQNQAGQ